MPEAGEAAPDFEATLHDGSVIRLSQLAGKKVALYFYPKDNTPGCTKQACNLRDNWSELQENGIQIIGVSKDSEASHVKFKQKYALPFPLIADADLSVHKLFGVWGEKNMYGRKILGVKRTTFLIDENGQIVHVIKRPKTNDHAAEILDKFGL